MALLAGHQESYTWLHWLQMKRWAGEDDKERVSTLGFNFGTGLGHQSHRVTSVWIGSSREPAHAQSLGGTGRRRRRFRQQGRSTGEAAINYRRLCTNGIRSAQ